jgi:predicted dithiol-disulfide oxidoreductase (DUF899 family)
VAELELRRQLEEVAAQRRELPVGGPVPQDYVFDEGAAELADQGTVRPVTLSQLFAPGKDTLVLYSYMFGPEMDEPCPMCTSFIDGLNATAPHAAQRLNLAVVARSPIGRLREVARQRGWTLLRLLSSSGCSYHPDYFGEDAAGGQWPVLNVFVRREGRVHHFYSTEALFVDQPGEPCHLDLMWPLWNLFDLTPEGRGETWYPQLSYAR